MAGLTTSLVNRRISRQNAPESALDLYQRLVAAGVIEPMIEEWIPGGDLSCAFPIREECRTFDAAFDDYFHKRRFFVDLRIGVTDHAWSNHSDGSVRLVSSPSPDSGLYYNYDGGFEINCPYCGHPADFMETSSEIVMEGLNAWCDDRDSASIRCICCGASPLVRDWTSDEHVFAAGHLAVTVSHGHLTPLTDNPPSPEATAIRRLLGDINDDYAVVFCRI
jgi:hypothetical protein